jgi:hypothetical protein
LRALSILATLRSPTAPLRQQRRNVHLLRRLDCVTLGLRGNCDDARDATGTANAPHGVMRTSPILLLAACATTAAPRTVTGPRGLRADEHRAAAEQHDQLARRTPPAVAYVPGVPASPWFFSWDTSAEHERLAATHRGEALALDAAYQEACGDRPYAEVSISPLTRHALGMWATSAGVIIYLAADAGPPERLLADLRCHRAWMMLQAAAGMDECPLDLPGLLLDARGDRENITLSIVVRDPSVVDELHRRTARELELRNQREHAH